ncbi:uridine kinase [Sporolactobacillus sp. Y61]|uniref:Uridine kinase n=1 Tax=Sporolactobacillus sp. Y61 TaxID=3160863 RepID=A0AAU8IEC6_9BACL|nr:uridine kinase [Sporolactobacillus sp. THM19-2]RYL94742.1 uridine kinase [Sporolactobacillus sp. THM19-2]
MTREKPIVIGVAGGSGSGKTTVTREISRYFPDKSIAVIQQDSYYKAQDDKPLEERLLTNYDHPLAFDTDLLIDQVKELLRFHPIKKPVYDYTVHTRSDKIVPVEPKDVIILEGILILQEKRLRDLMDIKVFVDTDSDLRIIRRLLRDTQERGRSVESVINQYLTAVRPMHRQFCEPTKVFADIIIPEGGSNTVAIDLMATKIKAVLEDRGRCLND